MDRTSELAGTCRLIVVFALCAAPTLVRAQHMGHGFHPGTQLQARGGGQPRFFGGYRGVYHASIAGSRSRYGTYWGHPNYVGPYHGLRFGIGFGWGPYSYWSYGPIYPFWNGYYGYGAWTFPPGYYPQYRPCDYRYSDRCQCSRNPEDRDTSGHQSAERQSAPRQSTNPPSPNQNLEPPEDIDPDGSRATKLVVYRVPMRHDLQSALHALRGMPPSARERWLSSGHYNNFSLQERELLKRMADDHPPSTLSLH
jgi:hypothetical protein